MSGDNLSEYAEGFGPIALIEQDIVNRANDIEGAIEVLVAISHTTAYEKGWHPDTETPTFGEQMALIHSEVSESLEAWRDYGDVVPRYEHFETSAMSKPHGVPSELADILIRVFDVAGKYHIDLGSALIDKLSFNLTRPVRHGGKKL